MAADLRGTVSVDAAIARGTLLVNGPVFLLLFAPVGLVVGLLKIGVLPDRLGWLGVPAFVVGFVLAWTWWALAVPRWRLWAWERVDDVAALKRAAVDAGLTWPDGHVLARTEIKSPAQRERERALDPDQREAGVASARDRDGVSGPRTPSA